MGLLGLPPRQEQLARLVAAGKPNKIIDYEMGTAPGVAKSKLHTLFMRLQVSNRLELARKVWEAEQNASATH